jgi:hypothetical protein
MSTFHHLRSGSRRLKCFGMKGAGNKESDAGGDYQLEEESH